MEIIIDSIVYQLQSQGGLSRIFNEILPLMCEIDPTLRIDLLTPPRYTFALPVHSQIACRTVPPLEQLIGAGGLWIPLAPQARAILQRIVLGKARKRIWHSTYYTVPFFWDAPVVITVADLIYERFANLFHRPMDEFFRRHMRHCVEAAQTVICISNTTQIDVQQIYNIPAERIRVIPLACSNIFKPVDFSNCVPEIPMAKPFLLYVGSRAHYKNFEQLLYCYSVWERRNEVTLAVVGGAWSIKEEQTLAEMKINDQVVLFRNVQDRVLCQLYNQAMALVYPSLYEGFGIPLLEAMACGCPVVASKIPSTIEVAIDCPIYFEPTEPDDLLVALDKVVQEGRASKRTQLGIERAKQYSWDETARKTLEVYHELAVSI